jgi:hypothetical protein
MMRIPKAVAAAAMLTSSSISAQAAATCEQFKAGVVEGAAEHQMPAPKFRLVGNNSADPDITYWTITTFDNVRAAIICSHGSVEAFMADANDSELTSSIHLLLLMAIGLHGYGMEWREALDLRDQLVRTAKASDPHISELPVDGGKASLIISFAGVPSFEIKTENPR